MTKTQMPRIKVEMEEDIDAPESTCEVEVTNQPDRVAARVHALAWVRKISPEFRYRLTAKELKRTAHLPKGIL